MLHKYTVSLENHQLASSGQSLQVLFYLKLYSFVNTRKACDLVKAMGFICLVCSLISYVSLCNTKIAWLWLITIISFLSESVLPYNFITRNGGQHERKAPQINLGKHYSNPSDHHTAATKDEMCGSVSEKWNLFSGHLQNRSRECWQLCSNGLRASRESDGQKWRLESCHIVLSMQ